MYTLKKIGRFTKGQTRQSGYTLLQMAIGMLVIGIIMAYSGYVYSLYLKNKNITQTQSNVQNMVSAIQTYRQVNGRYPCPAAMNVPRNDPAYGVETVCTDTSVAPGDCGGGICVESAVDGTGYVLSNGVNITPPDRAAALALPRVRVGAIPFRLLQIDEKTTYDAYGMRMVYAMTESMASTATFEEGNGAISVVTGTGESLSDPAGSIPFLILSTGANRTGAYNSLGNETVVCGGVSLESENCRDFAGLAGPAQSIYTSTYQTEGSATDNFDDVIEYFAASVNPVWKRTTANLENIETLAEDNVGIDVLNPTNALEIPQSDVSGQKGALRVTEKVKADRYCDENGNNCFSTSRISGVEADGLKCAGMGQYMVGIEGGGTDGAAMCDEVRTYCTNDALPVLRGFNLSGEPVCVAKPLSPCNTAVQICAAGGFSIKGSSQIAAMTNGFNVSGAHGATPNVTDVTSYGANPAKAVFKCNNGSWEYQNISSGLCACVAPDPSELTKTVSMSCAGILAGVNNATKQVTWNSTQCRYDDVTGTANYSACNCVKPADKAATTQNCPTDGYNAGIKTQNYVFNTAKDKCAWENGSLDNTCTCDPSLMVPPTFNGAEKTVVAATQTCASQAGPGFTGVLKQVQVFDGGSGPGRCAWKHKEYIKTDCTCDTTTVFPGADKHVCDLNCSTEIKPEKYQYRYVDNAGVCEKGPETKVSDAVCSPLSFYWKQTSGEANGPPSGTSQGKPEVNEACSCAQKATSGSCFQKQTDGQYKFYPCTCQ